MKNACHILNPYTPPYSIIIIFILTYTIPYTISLTQERSPDNPVAWPVADDDVDPAISVLLLFFTQTFSDVVIIYILPGKKKGC